MKQGKSFLWPRLFAGGATFYMKGLVVITLYSLPGCVQCSATLRAFERHGVHVNQVDLSIEHAKRDELKSWGFLTAPVVEAEINGEVRRWSGYKPDLIRKAAAATQHMSNPDRTHPKKLIHR
ncbi:glutaredoxin family protein [Trueperella sp. LYQ143]|uniref:glutaredoxin family protein n=1 Tax=Trueperella sp. LYQ143 TaxID=3391059 RepID=UPI0039830F3A